MASNAPSAPPSRRPRAPRGRKDDAPEVRLSKRLSYALRHGATDLGLTMRPSGYVMMTELLALPTFRAYTEAQIESVVQNNDKKRFTIAVLPQEERQEDGSLMVTETKFIRANQGHSLTMVEEHALLERLGDPSQVAVCIHGTYERLWPFIWEQGLSRMTRNHIHMTPRESVDGEQVVSGIRANCNLRIYIDFAMAMKDGIAFYRSSNNVILSPGIGDTGVIPSKYFVKAVRTDGRVLYQRHDESEHEE